MKVVMMRPVLSLLAILLVLDCASLVRAAGPAPSRLIVVLYPESSDGRPGNALVDRGIRATFASGTDEQLEIHNEYLDTSRFPDAGYQDELASFLRRKYSERKVDMVIAVLATGLEFALKYRTQVFPGAPVIFCAVDRKEIEARHPEPDVIGVPMQMDLAASLDLGLRFHPNTRQVLVVVGKSKFDAYWLAEAQRRFQKYSDKVKIVYLSGLPMEELVEKLKNLPDRSLIYYLHVLEDGDGKVSVPAEVLERLSKVTNAPIYGHVDTYVGRGIVGGRVFSFEAEGKHAAQLGLRILAGEKPSQIGVQQTREDAYMFDWRQLKRWKIDEASLPPGSIVLYKEQSLWVLYRWQIIAVVLLCVCQAALITGLIVQRSRRARAEHELHESRVALQELAGKLLGAQETERRRIARELHDDLGQGLALLSVELDLLQQKLPETASPLRPGMEAMSEQVKELSTSIHDLSHQLHPMKLEQLGLVAAVRSLCAELTQAHGVNIEFSHDDLAAGVPRETAICLYRIAQEALRNVIKHSGARRADVELRNLGNAVCLAVRDDGKGFDPGSISRQDGLGLASMRERVRLVNGAFTVDSQPVGGTRIEVRVPLVRQGDGTVES